MYYNPISNEIKTKEEVKIIVNASFPDNTLEIDGWHLIDETSLYPYVDDKHAAVQSGVAFNEGRWARTYIVQPIESSVKQDIDKQAMPVIDISSYIELQQKCAVLEKAVADLGQIVSNLEVYRRIAENSIDPDSGN